MRTKKLRVWDEDNKRMYPAFDLVEYMYSSEDRQEELAPTNVRKILLDYTGFKDCKGAEIYEGDIVVNKSGVTWEIEWGEDKGAWRYVRGYRFELNHKKTGFGLTYLASLTLEVIGNIYENPELLTN